MAVATIIGAIVAAGATVAGGVMQNQATEKANGLNLSLAKLTRSDELKQLGVQNKQNQQSYDLSLRGQAFNEATITQNRTDQLEQTGYDRMQHAADKFAEYRNSKVALNSARLSPLMKAA
jgi:hypothetical protein